MNEIYSRTPINKTAAMVTSQSGCATDGTLSNGQLLENLVLHAKALEVKILKTSKSSKERKKLGAQKRIVCDQITELKASLPKWPSDASISNYVMDILKEDMTKPEYSRLLKRADERMKAAIKAQENE